MKTELLDRCILCESDTLEVLDPACNIAKCRNCGFVFDNPRPTLDELVRFYSAPAKYDSWLAELGPREQIWKRRLRMLLPFRKAGSLLDVGAGIGQFLFLARDSFSKVYGTEVSTTAVEIAKDRYNIELFEGTIEDLQRSSRSFDNITLFHVLEHVPNPKSTLEICHSLLSPNGMLTIAVPNEIISLRALVRRGRAAIGLQKLDGLGKLGVPRIDLTPGTSEVHLSHFSNRVLTGLLESTGFSVVKTSLDPYRLKTGIKKLKPEIYYYACLAFLQAFGTNLYDTIFVIARKG